MPSLSPSRRPRWTASVRMASRTRTGADRTSFVGSEPTPLGAGVLFDGLQKTGVPLKRLLQSPPHPRTPARRVHSPTMVGIDGACPGTPGRKLVLSGPGFEPRQWRASARVQAARATAVARPATSSWGGRAAQPISPAALCRGPAARPLTASGRPLCSCWAGGPHPLPSPQHALSRAPIPPSHCCRPSPLSARARGEERG